MDRKSFIKRLTAAALGIVVTKPIIDALAENIWVKNTEFVITFDKPWIDPISPQALAEDFIRRYPITNDMLNKLIADLKASDYDFTLNPKLYESNTDASKRYSKPTT